jgi:hypothetical protein
MVKWKEAVYTYFKVALIIPHFHNEEERSQFLN